MALFTAVIGRAGSGKTYRVQELCKLDPRYCLKTSTSGISAVHLGGTTINSTLGYFDTEELFYKLADGTLISTFKKIKKDYDRLYLDEISMMSGMQLNCIVKGIQIYNQKFPNNPLGLELSGDFGQLSAVNDIPAFQSKFWNLFDIQYLNEVKRQDNKEFVEALNQIRAGNPEDAADWLEANVGFHKKLDPDFIGTTILSTNKEVDTYNYSSLKKVNTVSKTYKPILKGKAKVEWKQIPDQLTLKPGASVILLSNKLPEYANGDLATVKEVFAESVLVELYRTKKEHLITYHKLENQPVGSEKVIGTLEYIPLRLSYSLNVFKVQGLTLDQVQIKFAHNFWSRMHGGLYVACSRIRTPEGLRLVGTKDQFIKACYVNEIYKPYIN